MNNIPASNSENENNVAPVIVEEDDSFTKVENDDQCSITSHALDCSESSAEARVIIETPAELQSPLVATSINSHENTAINADSKEDSELKPAGSHQIDETTTEFTSTEKAKVGENSGIHRHEDNHSKDSVFSSDNSDSRSSDDSASYESGSSCEGDGNKQTVFSQPAIFNRFSAWRKQAATTLQQTATSLRVAKVSSTSLMQNKASSAPLQDASLSPAATTTNDNTQVNLFSETNATEVIHEAPTVPPLDIINAHNSATAGPLIDEVEIKPSSTLDPWNDLSEFENKRVTPSSAYLFGTSSQNLRPQIDVLSRAAANVVDSVQSSYFRGRYATGTNSTNSVTQTSVSADSDSQISDQRHGTYSNASNAPSLTNGPTPTSQTARIMSSPSAVHMQDIVSSLQPNEVVMLLGRGRLGVNLKQTYKKNTGVFVDFVVEGGAAHTAAVAGVGDILKQIGTDDVQINGTILSVPAQIAKASRPVQLIFRSGVTDSSNVSKINFVDISIAVMHELLQQNHDMEQLVDDTSTTSSVSCDFPSFESIDALTYPVNPPALIQKTYSNSIGKRNMLPIDYGRSGSSVQNENHDIVVKEICQLAAAHPSTFQRALQGAFLLCCVDSRRVQYLKNQFSGNTFPAVSQNAISYIHPPQQKSDDPATEECRVDSMMLEMFLELQEFVDFFDITPNRRRHSIALRIAQKYIFPTKVVVNGLTTLIPPPMDLHSKLVSDTELRALEGILLTKKDEILSNDLHRDVFREFQLACFKQLSCGSAFGKFMISAECSRMRAYLRNTAPFLNVPLTVVINNICGFEEGKNIHAMNYAQYCILFLISLSDREIYSENDTMLDQKVPPAGSNKSDRIEDAANGFCAAVFIRCKLLPACEIAKSIICDDAIDRITMDMPPIESMINLFEMLWENFVSPNVGTLAATAASSPNEEDILDALLECRSVLQKVAISPPDNGNEAGETMYFKAKRFLCDDVINSCNELALELLFDYATSLHAKFKMHKFHEWLCEEALIATHYKAKGEESEPSKAKQACAPELPHGCIKRLLRKADFPAGISLHKPSNINKATEITLNSRSSYDKTKIDQISAECALVFGTSFGLDCNAPACGGLTPGQGDIRRYACSSVILADDCSSSDMGLHLQPTDIPSTFESYSIVPRTPEKPFGKYSNCSNISVDGWKVSIIDFVIPRADSKSSSTNDGGDSWLYGVSLILQKYIKSDTDKPIENHFSSELVVDPNSAERESFVSMAESQSTRNIIVSKECPQFNSCLKKESWYHRINNGTALIGVSLASQRNVIFSMRNALSMLLQSFSTSPADDGGINRLHCGPLVDVLGAFSHPEAETDAIKCFLEPYLRKAASSWIHRPILDQRICFEENAGQQLIRCLPPIPLALMFVTILLEQKVVISSSRRSMLLSVTTAVTELLKPLKWCHLIVPQVPASLASDLLQYPAPSILGLCSEDAGTVDLVRNLNHDVTLVDLDVGRVILASSFAHDSELGRGTPNNAETARALRSQVLLLAQSLGNVFASQLDPQTWCCDTYSSQDVSTGNMSTDAHKFGKLKLLCKDFVEELLCGTTSCCYWIEEQVSEEYVTPNTSRDPTVLFDEDRFFQIKNMRERDIAFHPLIDSTASDGSSSSRQELRCALALSLDNFDLVLELFLRCQGMNAYIGSRNRDEMFFSL